MEASWSPLAAFACLPDRRAPPAPPLPSSRWRGSSPRPARDAIVPDLVWLSSWIERRSRVLLLTLALMTGVVAAAFATRSPSGADASGYLSQAAMWAGLEWRVADPLSADANWPLRPDQTAPLGWRPALERGWQVPTYAPGLPLLMAVPFAIAGNAGASAVVTLSAALAVLATGALARALAGGTAGLLAAALLAGSPTFLYQSLQPMSDVPITALWITAFWALTANWHGAAGVATALAVLVRPNLAPLAAVPLLWIAWSAPRDRRVASALRFSWPVAIAAVVVAGLQWQWYGSPFLSGYGAAGELFTLSNVVPNARLYGAWMWEAEPVFVLTGALALGVALATRAWPAPGARDAEPADPPHHHRDASRRHRAGRVRVRRGGGLSRLRRLRALVVRALPAARDGGGRRAVRHRRGPGDPSSGARRVRSARRRGGRGDGRRRLSPSRAGSRCSRWRT